MRILEGRRIRLEEKRERFRGKVGSARERVDRYTIEMHRHGLESVEREVRWLTELIETERTINEGGTPPPRSPSIDAPEATRSAGSPPAPKADAP